MNTTPSAFLLFLLAALLLLQQTASFPVIVGGARHQVKVPVLCGRYRAGSFHSPIDGQQRSVTPCAQLNDAYKSYYTRAARASAETAYTEEDDEEQISKVPKGGQVQIVPETREWHGYRFLISNPKVRSKEFESSVIYMFGMDYESTKGWGNAGFIMNRPLGIFASDILVTFFGSSELPSSLENEFVYSGGPHQKTMYNIVVAVDPSNPELDALDKSQWGMIGKNLYIMGIGPFRELVVYNNTYYANTGKSLTTFWRMFAGYSMWENGQLAKELSTTSMWTEYRTLSFPKSVLEKLDKKVLYWHMVKLSENKKNAEKNKYHI